MFFNALFAGLLSFGVNLPFGYIREGMKKFSIGWFLAVHFPVPFVFLVRVGSDLSYWYIPLLLVSSILGQFIGGKYRSKRVSPGS